MKKAKATKRSNKRKRNFMRVMVRMDEDEALKVKQKAAGAGITVAALMRTTSLGYRPTSILDNEHIRQLIRVRGDQGRLGGLLKLWLTKETLQKDIDKEKIKKLDILKLLANLGETQQEVAKIVGEISKGS